MNNILWLGIIIFIIWINSIIYFIKNISDACSDATIWHTIIFSVITIIGFSLIAIILSTNFKPKKDLKQIMVPSESTKVWSVQNNSITDISNYDLLTTSNYDSLCTITTYTYHVKMIIINKDTIKKIKGDVIVILEDSMGNIEEYNWTGTY